jgi:hypothetical protein
MPNLDGGHYFLTVLAPIDNRRPVVHDGIRSSPVHRVREALETLPTALQSPATEQIGLNSPFSRNTRTHFARFAVLDDVFYNGRDPVDSIVSAVAGPNPIQPQPVDALACPYLLFVADFDPAVNDETEPRSYLEALWDIMPRELEAVFGHCYGFAAVRDRAAFADFVIACQVETTMPFNDYWVGAPPLPNRLPWFVVAPVIAALASVGLAFWIPHVWAAPAHAQFVAWLGATVALLLAALGVDYGLVMTLGQRPFPSAPNATLPHVLKALYLQQAFTRFAAAHQGDDPATLRRAFAAFVEQDRPDDLAGPTQGPGVVKTSAGQGA